jgi:ribosomal protein S27AE
VEKRIAIVFSDVIREIYKMRGGKVVNSNKKAEKCGKS